VKNAADWTLLVFAALVTCFALTYVMRSPWWRNRIGEIYLVKSVILSLVLVQISLATWVSTEYPGRDVVRLIIYTLGIISYVVMLWALVREQNEDRAQKRAEKAKAERGQASDESDDATQ
jgi:glucan phosphoethanolaminetransferase (alkaline phosphatase superfamily)